MLLLWGSVFLLLHNKACNLITYKGKKRKIFTHIIAHVIALPENHSTLFCLIFHF